MTASLAVYYVGPGNRLFREFHRVPAGHGSPAARIQAALAEMMRPGSALDPDYRNLWSCRIRGLTVSGPQVTVVLGADCAIPSDRMRQQQLVWTATQIPGIDTVVLRAGGVVGQPLHRLASTDILAPIWVIDPQQGAVVGGSVTVTIDGTAFEAAAAVRIRDAAGKVVVQRSVQVGSAAVPNRAATAVTVRLAPGRYTVEGFVFSARDGSVQDLDDHQFT
ncbi:MAG: GerMN domain-containing protein, partial [Micromonosporaceae bacterium]|nr:GerMN domain-containing protein [Micromonosporaceae bacterium]